MLKIIYCINASSIATVRGYGLEIAKIAMLHGVRKVSGMAFSMSITDSKFPEYQIPICHGRTDSKK